MDTITLCAIKVEKIAAGGYEPGVSTFYDNDPFRKELRVFIYDGVDKRTGKVRFLGSGGGSFLLSPDDTLYFYPNVPFEVDKIYPSHVHKGVTITIHPPTNITPLNYLNPLNPLKGD